MRSALLMIVAICLGWHLSAPAVGQDDANVIPGVDELQLSIVRQWWREQGERSAVPRRRRAFCGVCQG
ncbi:MAG: hypothetical protein R3C05_09685 [Pirellulaceae bacterium]